MKVGGLLLAVAIVLAAIASPAVSVADYRKKLAAIEREIDVVPQLGAHEITIDYYAGQVTLSGTVASERVRQAVEAAAVRVAGITGVGNRLEVGTLAGQSDARARCSSPRSVSAVVNAERGVRDALRNISEFDTSSIEVRVERGVVILKGGLSNFREVDRVLATTLNVEGVKEIQSELTIAGKEYQTRRFLQ